MVVQVLDNSHTLYDDFCKDKDIKPHDVQEEFLQLPDDIFEADLGTIQKVFIGAIAMHDALDDDVGEIDIE